MRRQGIRANSGRGGISRSQEVVAGTSAIVVIALLAITGYFILHSSSNIKPIALLVAADDTGSVHTQMRQEVFGILDQTVAETLPHGSHVIFWSYDVNSHQYSDIVPNHAEDLWPTEDLIMKQHPTSYGTHPGIVLKDMLTTIKSNEMLNRPVAIMLLTDGEDQAPKETASALKSISSDPDVRAVWFCGATSQNGFRSMLERRWAPILGKRLIVTGPDDAETGLNKFRMLISTPSQGN